MSRDRDRARLYSAAMPSFLDLLAERTVLLADPDGTFLNAHLRPLFA